MDELITIDNIKFLKEEKDLEMKKAQTAFPRDALETYSAFANCDGGILILGMEEKNGTFDISGVDNPSKVIKELFDNLQNPQKVSLNLLTDDNIDVKIIDNKSIIIIDVPYAKHTQKPVYLNNNVFKCYLRLNSGDYICSEEQAKAMLRDSSPESYDSRTLSKFSIDDLDKETIKNYRNRFATIKPTHNFNGFDDETFLYKIGALIKNRDNNSLCPSIAGLLVFGLYTSIREVIPHYHVEYINKTEVGITTERWNDRIIYDGTWGEGNLYNFFFTCINKLYTTLSSSFELENDLTRKEDSPMRIALREALVNTIIHCDFQSTVGIKIVRLPHSFEFTNGGTLRISKQNFFSGEFSEPRNHYIQEIFRHINLCERAGTGIPKIMDAIKHYSLNYPKLNISPNSVEFSIFDTSIIDIAHDITSQEKEILEYIVGKKIISRNDIDSTFKLNKAESLKILNTLCEKKYIIKFGKSTATKYRINEGTDSSDFEKYEVIKMLSELQHEIKKY